MQKIILPILLFLSCSLFAQPQKLSCGNESHLNHILQNDPEAVERMQAIEEYTQQWISENQNQVQLREVITIPVVVHIVFREDADKISNLEIEAQIDGLTADFRKLNDNSSIIPDVFKPLAADVEIEFCLASLDPEGNVTEGIIRRETTVENIGTFKVNEGTPNALRGICYSSLGGSDAWDTESYLNIWVGQFRDNVLGEAPRPGQTLPAEDGVYIDPDFFGFFCSSENDFHLGRTLTHEVGHYFNLLHMWGDDFGCQFDDLVDDTPLQEFPYRDCPTHPQSSCGSEDMFMNFMDYVDDQCMALFTHGQKMRMLATLDSVRAGLKTSKGCDWLREIPKSIKAESITVFPNPAKDCVHIDLNVDNELPVQLQLINSAGQLVYSNEVFVKDVRAFDVTPYADGIYFLYFKIGNSFATKKLIINK